jgi:hypothetical protein
MKNFFKSYAQKGAFGEFVYQLHVQRCSIQAIPVRILEYDFLLTDALGGSHKIDVKTTAKNVNVYGGRRIRPEIIYDLVKLSDQDVILIPDKNSPLNAFGVSQRIGSFPELYDQWREARIGKKQSHGNTRDIASPIRAQLKKRISEHFSPLKVRIVFRGEVSETRWSSLPDNLPGTKNTILKYDVTVFIQMQTHGETELASRAFILVHSATDRLPLNDGDLRQKKKGILKVLDIASYEKEFPHLIFDSIDEVLKVNTSLFASK